MSGEQHHKVVEAQEFRLLDKEGRVRARVFLEDDEPKVALFSRENKKRAAIGLLPTGEAGIALYDDEGKYHVLMNVSAKGIPDLSIRDRNGKEMMLFQEEKSMELETDILPHVKNKGLKWLLKK
jgi:hypothetical protein